MYDQKSCIDCEMELNPNDITLISKFEEKHWWYQERRHILKKFLIENSISGTVVDIGAAGGGNSKVAKELGLKVIAVEPTLEGANLCRQKGIETIQALAGDLPIPDSTANCVIMMDVLEHIEDDFTALIDAKRILRSDGLMFITVPMDMELWSEHDVASMHFRRYSKENLFELFQKSGLEIINFSYWNVLLRPVLKFRRKNKIGNDLKAPNSILNRLLRLIVTLERFFDFYKIKGVSSIIVAKKTN